MKIDLIKEVRKLNVNSLGVAIKRKRVATKINGGVIGTRKNSLSTVENVRIFISQTINVIMVQLPHRVSGKK